MNLYIINEISIASHYGIGTYIDELIPCIKNHVHLNIITLNFQEGEFNIYNKDNVIYWNIPYPFVQNGLPITHLSSKINYYQSVVDLLKIYIKDRSNLVFHFNYTHNPFYVLAQLLKKNFQCKIVATIHYMNWALLFNGNATYVKQLAGGNSAEGKSLAKSIQAEKKLFELCDHIIGLTEHSVKSFLYIYDIDKTKISIIPHGIKDVYNHYKKNNRHTLREKNHISVDEKIILYVGRLDELKGVSYLITAFRRLLQQYKKCHLYIVGSGNYNFYLKQTRYIEKNISFTGKLSKNELYELMSIADIGVMPSLYEPFGYVVIEMMMFALPIVTTSQLRELLENNISGQLIPIIEHKDKKAEIDPEILFHKMYALLQNPTWGKMLGINARKTFIKKFEVQSFKRRMINLYDQLLT